MVGCGGLLRDSSRNWVKGYALKIGLGDALKTNIWAILHGIELVWHDRITSLVVESDSKVLIDMVNQEIEDGHNFLTLVRRIRRMTQKNWHIKLNHI